MTSMGAPAPGAGGSPDRPDERRRSIMFADLPPAAAGGARVQASDASAATGSSPTRVLCVDDSPDICDLLSQMMRGQADLECVGSLGSAAGLVEEARLKRADVVVLDLTMAGADAMGAMRALVEALPACRVIAYSGHDDARTRETARAAGACELVSKHGEPWDILRAIRRARDGGVGERG